MPRFLTFSGTVLLDQNRQVTGAELIRHTKEQLSGGVGHWALEKAIDLGLHIAYL